MHRPHIASAAAVPDGHRVLKRKHLGLTLDDIIRSCPEFNSATNRRYSRTDVSTFHKTFSDEDCCHFVSNAPRRWISKVQRRSGTFANSGCQSNSDTYTDANTNR
jgi:hypothetical protein